MLTLLSRHVYEPVKRRFFEKKAAIAIIRLSGVIGTGSRTRQTLDADSLQPIIEKAFKTPRLKAVALAINSPGGSPVQSQLIYQSIRREAEKQGVPVLAFIEDVGASGGYWLACAADEIFAAEASIVGSIGVVAAGFGFQEFIKRHGVERRIITQGENKAMLDPFEPVNPVHVEHLRALQKDVHECFKNLVRSRRAGKLTAEEDTLFSGLFWAGVHAQRLGLIDGVGELREICMARFGDDLEFKIQRAPKSFLARKLGAFSAQGLVDAVAEKLDEKALLSQYGL